MRVCHARSCNKLGWVGWFSCLVILILVGVEGDAGS